MGTGDDLFTARNDAALASGFNPFDARVTIDGQAGSDTYEIFTYNIFGDSSFFRILDTGGLAEGVDRLTLQGTSENDHFLFRKNFIASVHYNDTGLVAGVAPELLGVERFDISEGLNEIIVNGWNGDDRFAFDETVSVVVANGMEGDDVFQIGQLFDTTREEIQSDGGGVALLADTFEVARTTKGFLSNGVLLPATCNGGVGKDTFDVLRNKGSIDLNGGDGDDSFIVRAFALDGSLDPDEPSDPTDANVARVAGGGGADTIQYTFNAPVDIDGGDGFDEVTVVGTEFSDDFVITEEGIFGAGLNIAFSNIERITLITGEGDDEIFVYGTSAEIDITVFGGLGSDSIEITPSASKTVQLTDPRGSNVAIEHVVSSPVDTNFDLEYKDRSPPNVVLFVAEKAGPPRLIVTGIEEVNYIEEVREKNKQGSDHRYNLDRKRREKPVWFTIFRSLNSFFFLFFKKNLCFISPKDATNTADGQFSYGIRLAQAPTDGDVVVTVSAQEPPDDRKLLGQSWVDITTPRQLIFTTSNWATPQTITVQATSNDVSDVDEDNTAYEVVQIQHAVLQENDGAYDRAVVGNVPVTRLDDDTEALFAITGGKEVLACEGNATTRIVADYAVEFTPCSAGGKDVALDFDDSQLDVWYEACGTGAETPVANGDVLNLPAACECRLSFHATAKEDAAREGIQFYFIKYTTPTSDNSKTLLASVRVKTYDADVADFIVLQSGGNTLISESTEAGVGDSYFVRPAAAPTATVYLQLQTPAGVSLYNSAGQVITELAFDPDNYFVFQEVVVAADPAATSGIPTQPATERTFEGGSGLVKKLFGPLTIDGGFSEGVETPQVPLILPTETNECCFVPLVVTSNLLVTESEQVDTMIIWDQDNGGDVGAQLSDTIVNGLPTTTLTGLDMVARGSLSWRNCENIELNLGTGANEVDIDMHSHFGATTIYTSNGNDIINIKSTVGHLFVDTARGSDTINIGEGVLGDAMRGLVSVSGGDPLEKVTGDHDVLNLPNGDDTNPNVYKLTRNTLEELTTVTTAQERLDTGFFQLLTLRADSGNATLSFADSIALGATGATAIDIDAPVTPVELPKDSTAAYLSDLLQANVFASVNTQRPTRPDSSAYPNFACGSQARSRCARSFLVRKYRTLNATTDQVNEHFHVVYQGQFAAELGEALGVMQLDTSELVNWQDESFDSVQQDLRRRTHGVNYYNFEVVNLQTGSAKDVMNIRGTVAGEATNIKLGAGDDAVYISHNANEDQASSATTQELSGWMDYVEGGLLNLDAEGGRHVLMMSDEATKYAKGRASTPAHYSSGQTVTLRRSSLVGVSPAPIHYTATSGNYFGGITLWMGQLGDAVSVESTLKTGTQYRTTTTLNTNRGDDDVVVTLLEANNDGFFVCNTEENDDTIDARGSDIDLVLFGGLDQDTIYGGKAKDLIFGDCGHVDYKDSTGAVVARLGLGGHGDYTDGEIRYPAYMATRLDGQGAHDVIYGHGDRDFVVGGWDADEVHGDGGAGATSGTDDEDVLFGDEGEVTFDRTREFYPTQAVAYHQTTLPATAGLLDDDLSGDGQDDVILGGRGADYASGNDGLDILVGDEATVDWDLAARHVAKITTACAIADADAGFAVGHDNDELDGNDGNDVLIGSRGSDTLSGHAGADLIFGDSAVINLAYPWYVTASSQFDSNECMVEEAASVDVIDGGAGNNIVVAGYGADFVTVGDDLDVVLGDVGTVVFDQVSGNPVGSAETYCAYPGTFNHNDTIVLGHGDNVALAGPGDDHVTSGSGRDFVAGDSGAITLAYPKKVQFASAAALTCRLEAGQDTVVSGLGDDVVVAGHNGDVVYGDELVASATTGGLDVLVGDDATVVWNTADYASAANDNPVDTITSHCPFTQAIDDGDQIFASFGDDVVLGGQDADTVWAGVGKDLVLGDSAAVVLQYPRKVSASSVAACVTEAEVTVDTLHGEEGDDVIIAGFGPDVVTAGDGLDVVLGDGGVVLFDATDAGNPVTKATAHCPYPGTDANNGDNIDLGAGDDVCVAGQGADNVDAGAGDDLVLGDSGEVVLAYPVAVSAYSTVACAEDGEAGGDTVDLGAGRDTAILGNGGDVAYGRDGRDYIIADEGHVLFDPAGRPRELVTDCVLQAAGVASNDTVDGGNDEDIILGGRGKDLLRGGAGRDMIFGDNAVVILDALVVQEARTAGPSDGLLSTDLCHLEGDADEIYGGDDEDMLVGGTGGDVIHGDAGSDRIMGDHADYKITHPHWQQLRAILTTSADVASAVGANDQLYGDAGDDLIYGQQGSDQIWGGDGNDDLTGGHNINAGADAGDFIYGDEGADFIMGDNGLTRRDILAGSSTSSDPWVSGLQYELYPAPFADQVVRHHLRYDDWDYNQGANGDATFGNDHLEGGSGFDELHGQRGNDNLLGGAGQDLLFGELGNDSGDGGAGHDLIIADVGHALRDYDASGTPRLNSFGSWHIDVVLEEVGHLVSTVDIATKVSGLTATNIFAPDVLFLTGGYANGTDNKAFKTGTAWQTDLVGFNLLPAGDDNFAGGSGKDLLFMQRGDDHADGGVDDDIIFGDFVSSTIPYDEDMPKVLNTFRYLTDSAAGYTVNPHGATWIDDHSNGASFYATGQYGAVMSADFMLLPLAFEELHSIGWHEATALGTFVHPDVDCMRAHENVQVRPLTRADRPGQEQRAIVSFVASVQHNPAGLPGSDSLLGGADNDFIVGDWAREYSPLVFNLLRLENVIMRAWNVMDRAMRRLDILAFEHGVALGVGSQQYAAGNDHVETGEGHDVVYADIVDRMGRVFGPVDVPNSQVPSIGQDIAHYHYDLEWLFGNLDHAVYEAQLLNYEQLGGAAPTNQELLVGNDHVTSLDSINPNLLVGDGGQLVVTLLTKTSGDMAKEDMDKDSARTQLNNALQTLCNDRESTWADHVTTHLSPTPETAAAGNNRPDYSVLRTLGNDMLSGPGALCGDFGVTAYSYFVGLTNADPYAQPWPVDTKDCQAGDQALDYQNSRGLLSIALTQQGNMESSYTLPSFATGDNLLPDSLQHSDRLVGRDHSRDYISGRFCSTTVVVHPSETDPYALVQETQNFNARYSALLFDPAVALARSDFDNDTLTSGVGATVQDFISSTQIDTITDPESTDQNVNGVQYSPDDAQVVEVPVHNAISESGFLANFAYSVRNTLTGDGFPAEPYVLEFGEIVASTATCVNRHIRRRSAAAPEPSSQKLVAVAEEPQQAEADSAQAAASSSSSQWIALVVLVAAVAAVVTRRGLRARAATADDLPPEHRIDAATCRRNSVLIDLSPAVDDSSASLERVNE